MKVNELNDLIGKVYTDKEPSKIPAFWDRKVMTTIGGILQSIDASVSNMEQMLKEHTKKIDKLADLASGLANDMTMDYLTFTAESDNLRILIEGYDYSESELEYRMNDGEWMSGGMDLLLTKGDRVSYRAKAVPRVYDGIGSFHLDGHVKVSGTPLSLLYKDDASIYNLPIYAFYGLFKGNENTNVSIDASELKLPSNTLSEYCYSQMFMSSNLIAAPELPAKNLASSCYANMFYKCTSLKKAPALPATNLAYKCYDLMFYQCTSLESAPELPAVELTPSCYDGMFNGCTSLTTAPELPATVLASRCYANMFQDCTSLVNAPKLPATNLASACYAYMFFNCTSLVTAHTIHATKLATNCCLGMFMGCSSLKNVQSELYAKELAAECYYNMYNGCSALEIAPILPAKELVGTYDYSHMFNGCKNLRYLKALFVTPLETPSYRTRYWVENVAIDGVFVKSKDAQWNVVGVDGVPSGWTIEYADE